MAGTSIRKPTILSFSLTAKREFNFWMDPEASHAVLHAQWPRYRAHDRDISVKTRMGKGPDRAGTQEHHARRAIPRKYGEANYLWDELAAVAGLIHPSITKWKENST